MTSDINGTVVAIQGEAISSAAPQDGYVLVWDALDGYWKPQPQSSGGLITEYFTTNGTWTAPSNVSNILLIGCGGGGCGGGGSGNTGASGGGGGAALQSTVNVIVVPNTTYTITIGIGGSSDNLGGSDTTFDTLAAFCGAASGIYGDGNHGSSGNIGGAPVRPNGSSYVGNTTIITGAIPGQGGPGGGGQNIGGQAGGMRNLIGGYIGGSPGTNNTYFGGGGGAAGPQGNGGNGANGKSSGSANAGSSAAANTGAGGGGAGGTSGGSGNNASGGDGGSGYLYIVYVA